MPVDFAKELSKKHKLKFEDVYIIANHKVFGKVYLKALEKIDPTLATNWFRHKIPEPYLEKYDDINDVEEVNGDEIIELLELFGNKKVSDAVAKDILKKLVTEKISPSKYLKDNKLEMVSDSGELEKFCKEAIEANPKAVEGLQSRRREEFELLSRSSYEAI